MPATDEQQLLGVGGAELHADEYSKRPRRAAHAGRSLGGPQVSAKPQPRARRQSPARPAPPTQPDRPGTNHDQEHPHHRRPHPRCRRRSRRRLAGRRRPGVRRRARDEREKSESTATTTTTTTDNAQVAPLVQPSVVYETITWSGYIYDRYNKQYLRDKPFTRDHAVHRLRREPRRVRRHGRPLRRPRRRQGRAPARQAADWALENYYTNSYFLTADDVVGDYRIDTLSDGQVRRNQVDSVVKVSWGASVSGVDVLEAEAGPRARATRSSDEGDGALLKVDETELNAIELADTSDVEINSGVDRGRLPGDHRQLHRPGPDADLRRRQRQLHQDRGRRPALGLPAVRRALGRHVRWPDGRRGGSRDRREQLPLRGRAVQLRRPVRADPGADGQRRRRQRRLRDHPDLPRGHPCLLRRRPRDRDLRRWRRCSTSSPPTAWPRPTSTRPRSSPLPRPRRRAPITNWAGWIALAGGVVVAIVGGLTALMLLLRRARTGAPRPPSASRTGSGRSRPGTGAGRAGTAGPQPAYAPVPAGFAPTAPLRLRAAHVEWRRGAAEARSRRCTAPTCGDGHGDRDQLLQLLRNPERAARLTTQQPQLHTGGTAPVPRPGRCRVPGIRGSARRRGTPPPRPDTTSV